MLASRMQGTETYGVLRKHSRNEVGFLGLMLNDSMFCIENRSDFYSITLLVVSVYVLYFTLVQ